MTISLRPRGPFSLPSPLVVALTDDGGEPVALRAAWAEEAGEAEIDFVSDLPAERVERHAARVLSLDVDASGLAAVGTRMEIGDVEAVAFPAPPALASLGSFEGVWASKLERVRALAAAARAGDLDPVLLRGLELDDALTHLQSLPGIGPVRSDARPGPRRRPPRRPATDPAPLPGCRRRRLRA